MFILLTLGFHSLISELRRWLLLQFIFFRYLPIVQAYILARESRISLETKRLSTTLLK